MSDLAASALQIKSLRLEERQADFIASTDAMDADGDIVEQNWDLERYMSNPVVLFGHNSKELPIGHAKGVGVVDGKLQATIVFASEKANPMAERVWQSVQEKTLRAVSVGFKPREVRKETRNDKDVYVLSDNELYEISVVPIPSNPEALSKQKSFLASKGKYDNINFKPPKAVVSELKKGLKWHEEGHSGDGLKSETVSWARRMSNGTPISPDKARKMRAWLARHESDKSGEGFSPGEDGYPSPGRVAWALWGGDPAKGWSNKLVQQMEAADKGKAYEEIEELKGAVAYRAYPPVDSETWDGAAAEKRIAAWADGDWAKYRNGFAWFDSSNPEVKASYKLPHQDIQDGRMVTVRAGVIAAGNAVMGSRGGVDIPDADMAAVKAHLAKHYRQFNLTPPWEREESADGGKEKAMELEKAVAELEGIKSQLVAEKEKVETLNKRCMDLEEERNEYRKQADSLRVNAVEKTLDDLVGVKIAPTEKDTLIKLATQSPELFEEHLKAIESRPDMNILKSVSDDVIGEDPTPKALPVGDDSGAEFEALVKQLGA